MSVSTSQISSTLKDALFEALSSILSPIHDVRTSAEQQIKVLEVTDEFAVHLTELMLNSDAPIAIRQLASVLLKQYVESHWSENNEKFRPPETTPEAKAAIRAMLPIGLHESLSKLRSSIAYAMSAIAHWDWPDDWPELFDILLQSLISENNCAVHGAMRVLKEISSDLSDDQMPKFAPLILPEMLKVFIQDEKYGIRTRGRAVEIFTMIVEMISSMAAYKHSAKSLLLPILTPFTEALVSALKIPDGMTSDSGLKKDILNALIILIKHFPDHMMQWIPHILVPIWNNLTYSANIYITTVVNDSEEANNPVDSDGEVLGFENFIFSIFEFINALVESHHFRYHIENGMKDLMHYILLYMQITEDQIKTWNSNPDQFVEDEDDDTYAYSVRISAQDLLLTLSIEFPEKTPACLCEAIVHHIDKLDKISNPFWWKLHESCMLALCILKKPIIKQIKDSNLQFDIISFMQNLLLEDLNLSVSPFLYGRCLLLSSKYAIMLNADLIKRLLQATVNGVQCSQSPCVYISAIRAVSGFCDALKSTEYTQLLYPYLPQITEHLVSLAMLHSSEVLALILEAISLIIKIDVNFTAQAENKIVPLAIAVFLKHHHDPVLIIIAQEIFKELCRNPLCVGSVQQRLIPTLVSILQAQPMKVSLGLQAVALDILTTLVRNCSSSLPELIMAQAFPAALHCIIHSDDNTIMQNGGECLRAFVSSALDQVMAWKDDSGNSGLDYIIKVIQRMLDPKTPESASAFIGRLVSILITKANAAIGDSSEVLLRAVLSKMQQAEALSVIESLIMVFAYLICHQIEAVLNFLNGIPGPSGNSALEFVMNKWCEGHQFFFGTYERKVSIYSLSKILQFGLQNNDQQLQNIQVKGDQIFNFNEGPKTRLKSLQSPDEWTQIPLLVKIFKIILSDLIYLSDGNQDDDESSGDESDDTYENVEMSSKMNIVISALTGHDTSDCLSDCELEKDDLEDDPDILLDPIYSMNMKSYLTEYLQQLICHESYNTFSQFLSTHEKRQISMLGINKST